VELLIEHAARRVERRYRLNRDFSIGKDYSMPMVRMIDAMKTGVQESAGNEFAIRNLEQDPKTESKMEHKTAQFFLRNLPRVRREHEEQDEMPFKKEGSARPDFVSDNPVAYQRPRFLNQWSVNDFKWLQVVISKTLRDETWTDRFSREIRETLMRGLWTSNPDPLDLRRPEFWKKDG